MMREDLERKRASSREAARRRRRKETEAFGDLCDLLPVTSDLRPHLNKPSVLRLAISYLRQRTILTNCAATQRRREQEDERSGETAEGETWGGETDLYLGVANSFLLVVSTRGDMVFLSENVSKHMGLTQVELMGHSLYDFTNPCDHREIRNNLGVSGSWSRGSKRDFVVRMKSTLTTRGRTTNVHSATWKVLHCEGRMKVCASSSSSSQCCLLLTCQPLPLSHRLTSTHTFTSQHSMDMRFTHCDHRVKSLLGYSTEELRGRSLYDLCHMLDMHRLNKSHMNLLTLSQSVIGQYRMLVRGGGYVWAESHSTVIPGVCPGTSNPGSHQPPSASCILSVTYILSGVEEPSLQLSLDQTLCRRLTWN